MARIAEEQIDRLQLLTQKHANDLDTAAEALTTAQADIDTLQSDLDTAEAAMTAHAAALTWTAVTSFKNSWVNYGSSAVDAAYVKDAHGWVHVIGRIKDGTIGNAAFTLPTGYRPAEFRSFACNSNSAYGQINIETDGDVVPAIGNNASFFIVVNYYVG